MSTPSRASRPSTVGPESGPEAPFPLKLSGEVIKGFGRGSKELGIPTANIPIDGLSVAGHTDLASGVYFGYCSLSNTSSSKGSSEEGKDANEQSSQPHIYEMVMSVGWNPFYKNTKRSVEVHILHDFSQDFYGAHLKLLILGFVREELDYVSLEALVEDIKTDINVTKASLAREGWEVFERDEWLRDVSVV